jgi:hypothetical protein
MSVLSDRRRRDSVRGGACGCIGMVDGVEAPGTHAAAAVACGDVDAHGQPHPAAVVHDLVS